MTVPEYGRLTIAIFGGSAAIFAVLWVVAWMTPVGGKSIAAFIPLTLMWIAVCVWLSIRRSRADLSEEKRKGPHE